MFLITKVESSFSQIITVSNDILSNNSFKGYVINQTTLVPKAFYRMTQILYVIFSNNNRFIYFLIKNSFKGFFNPITTVSKPFFLLKIVSKTIFSKNNSYKG